jgi:hypothetical protein
MRAGAVFDVARDIAVVVDAVGKGLRVRRGIVDVGENAVAVDEGMAAGAVIVLADDLAHIIDAIEERTRRQRVRRRIVDRRVAAGAAGIIEKTVVAEGGAIVSNDQAGAIDVLGPRVAAPCAGGIRIVQGRIRCTAGRIVDEAVAPASAVIISDDQARAIDTLRKGAAIAGGSKRIVERGVNASGLDETMRICGIDVITGDLAAIVDRLS